MFYLGIFSSYTPYLIMAIFFGLYQLLGLFGNHAKDNETFGLLDARVINWNPSLDRPIVEASTYMFSFEKEQSEPKKQTVVFDYPASIKLQKIFSKDFDVNSFFHFELFSRPPPYLFLT